MADKSTQKKTLYYSIWDAHCNFLEAGGELPCSNYDIPRFIGSTSASELRNIIKDLYGVEVSGAWIKEYRERRGLTEHKPVINTELSANEDAIVDALQGPTGHAVGIGFNEQGQARLHEPPMLVVTKHVEGLYHVSKIAGINLYWLPQWMPRFTLEETIFFLRAFHVLKNVTMKQAWDRLAEELKPRDSVPAADGFIFHRTHNNIYTLISSRGELLRSKRPADVMRCFGYHYVPGYIARLVREQTQN